MWPLRCAHRGGGFEKPENTLEAFENALKVNILFLECDVHLTKDHQVVVAHDHDISRVCQVDASDTRTFIGEFNYAELPCYRKKF